MVSFVIIDRDDCQRVSWGDSSSPGAELDRHSRRVFLARLAAGLAAPAALSACRSDTSSEKSDTASQADDSSASSQSVVPAGAVARPAVPAKEPIVRVNLSLKRQPDAPFQIGPADRWLIVGPAGVQERSVVLRGPIRARLSRSGWSIVDSGGFSSSADAAETIEIALMDDPEPVLELGGRRYPGLVRLIPRGDADRGDFDIVNHVPLESYLPGVLSKELYSHWHLQTHMAQAIAARSFACCEAAWFARRRHFDLADTQASQVFSGLATRQTAIDAAAATRGMMLTFENLLVPGYFSSCCGGPAASAVDAIGPNPINDIAPLRGREGEDVCTAAPLYRWTAEQPLEILQRRISAFGRAQKRKDMIDLAELDAIEVAARNASGRPTKFALRYSAGIAVELAAEDFRRAAEFAGQGLGEPKQRLWSSNFQAVISGSAARFEGGGHGHGAGLCQYGAEARAKSGKDHSEIIQWYYPGATMAAAYS